MFSLPRILDKPTQPCLIALGEHVTARVRWLQPCCSYAIPPPGLVWGRWDVPGPAPQQAASPRGHSSLPPGARLHRGREHRRAALRGRHRPSREHGLQPAGPDPLRGRPGPLAPPRPRRPLPAPRRRPRRLGWAGLGSAGPGWAAPRPPAGRAGRAAGAAQRTCGRRRRRPLRGGCALARSRPAPPHADWPLAPVRSSGWPAGPSVRRAPSPPLSPPRPASSSAAAEGGGLGPTGGRPAALRAPPAPVPARSPRREGSWATLAPGEVRRGRAPACPAGQVGPARLPPASPRRCGAAALARPRPAELRARPPQLPRPRPPARRRPRFGRVAAGGALRRRARPGAHPPGARRLREARGSRPYGGAAQGAARLRRWRGPGAASGAAPGAARGQVRGGGGVPLSASSAARPLPAGAVPSSGFAGLWPGQAAGARAWSACLAAARPWGGGAGSAAARERPLGPSPPGGARAAAFPSGPGAFSRGPGSPRGRPLPLAPAPAGRAAGAGRRLRWCGSPSVGFPGLEGSGGAG